MNFRADNDDRRTPAFQMVAMVDVVFILLAFFVLASQFHRSERDFSMGYGRSGPPAGTPAPGDLPPHIPVRLQRSGAGVAITIGAARLRDNDFDGIRAKLTEIDMPAIGVRILAEAELGIEQFAAALDAVLASPMKNVSYSPLKVARAGRAAGESADTAEGG